VWRELACACFGLAVAAAAWLGADAIPRSALADAVGADGLPKRIAVALALVSGWIAARALLQASAPRAATAGFHARALGVPAIGLLCIWMMPWVGYPLAIGLLLAAAAQYYGAPSRARSALFAVAGAALLWLLFSRVLGVPLPGGPF